MKIKQVYKLFFLFFLIAIVTVACQSSSSEISVSENCRMIQHKAGETCVPNNPERLVTLFSATTADAIAVEVQPIGATEPIPTYLREKLEGIEKIGASTRPNLEKIATLTPDVIIGLHNQVESVYKQLSQIAPTLLHDWQGFNSWKDHFNFVAKALGKTEQAEDVWAHYEQRIQELREALGNNYQNIEVSVVRVCCNNLGSDVKNSFSGTILNDVGFSRPPAQDSAPSGLVIFSEELIPEKLDGDIIFAIVDDDSKKAFEQLKNNPLWNKLEAVQEGKVYPVNLATWRGGDPLAADAVIDDLFKYLVKE
jgi:iron complex transport system substrate-binding protein